MVFLNQKFEDIKPYYYHLTKNRKANYKNHWKFDLNMDINQSSYWGKPLSEKCQQIDIRVSLRFPQEDLDFIYKQFLKHNEKL